MLSINDLNCLAKRRRLQRVLEHVERVRWIGQRRQTGRGCLLGKDQDGRDTC